MIWSITTQHYQLLPLTVQPLNRRLNCLQSTICHLVPDIAEVSDFHQITDSMRGGYVGLATLIQNDCKKAIYIWCNAHHPKHLVMNGVMACSCQIKKTLGLLEELHEFMTGHRRNAAIKRSQARLPTSYAA